MLAQADFERALAFALGEFAPAWEIVGDCAPVDPVDPSHWGSGSRSFQVTLRHRVTGRLKVLGRRAADDPNASFHPAVALSPIGAYRHGDTEPIRRYLEEIGVAATTAGDAATFFRPPAPSPAASSGAAVAAVGAHHAASAATLVVGTAASDEADTKPRWTSLSAVTSRWRRQPRRPAFAGAAVGSGRHARAVDSRGRVLRRLKRELAIWQWRRSAGSTDLGISRTRE
jgi:hypothetical protein